VTRKPETAIELDGKPLGEDDRRDRVVGERDGDGELVRSAGASSTSEQARRLQGQVGQGKIALVHRFVPPEAPAGVQPERSGDLAARRSALQGVHRARQGAIGLVVVDDATPSKTSRRCPGRRRRQRSRRSRSSWSPARSRPGSPRASHRTRLAIALQPTRTDTSKWSA